MCEKSLLDRKARRNLNLVGDIYRQDDTKNASEYIEVISNYVNVLR